MSAESGADHADDLLYLFEPGPFQLFPPLESDAEMIYKMTTIWSYFALKGYVSSFSYLLNCQT